jgi:hypothetical protein
MSFRDVQDGRWAWLMVLSVLMVSQPAAAAPDRPSSPDVAAASVWTLEITGGVFREAWDYNLSDEDLGGGTTAVFRRLGRAWSVGVRALLLGVHQERVPSTIVSGGSLLVRWHRPRPSGDYFAEIAGGLSYAAGVVPQRGTQFNYVAESGMGVRRSLTGRTGLVATLSWLHLSNNGLAGRSRNPDIQAFGIRIGVTMPLAD